MRALSAAFNTGGQWEVRSGLYGYARGMALSGVPAGSVGVFWGANQGVHVQGTSAAAETVAGVLRQWWPDHLVSRADVAFDVDEAGAFDRLYPVVHEIARSGSASGGRKVSTSQAGDWLDRENGRTFYAGGSSSRGRIRLYEKGYEQRAKDPECGASLDWVRLEFVLRPTSDQKAWLAHATKAESIGLTPFLAAVAVAIVGENVPAVGASLRFASQDPAYWMVKQYRATVVRLLQLDPDEMRDQLLDLLDRVEGRQPAGVVVGVA